MKQLPRHTLPKTVKAWRPAGVGGLIFSPPPWPPGEVSNEVRRRGSCSLLEAGALLSIQRAKAVLFVLKISAREWTPGREVFEELGNIKEVEHPIIIEIDGQVIIQVQG